MLNRKLAPFLFLLLMVLSACATERTAESPPDAASNLVFFDRDQVSLSDKSMVTIKRFAEYSKRVLEARIGKNRSETRVDVVGFTDSSGSEIYNMALSPDAVNAAKVAHQYKRPFNPSSITVIITEGGTQSKEATAPGGSYMNGGNNRVELVLH